MSAEKRNRVKLFLDKLHDLFTTKQEKNLTKALEILKSFNLSADYLSSLKISKIIEKKDGSFKWNVSKPTLKLVDIVIDHASNITKKRNSGFIKKKAENVLKFMQTVYKKTRNVPRSLEKLKFKSILDKHNLKSEYGEALILKGYITSSVILTKDGTHHAYKWEGPEPDLKKAEQLYSFVFNKIQKQKEISKEFMAKTRPKTTSKNMKFIQNYFSYMKKQ